MSQGLQGSTLRAAVICSSTATEEEGKEREWAAEFPGASRPQAVGCVRAEHNQLERGTERAGR